MCVRDAFKEPTATALILVRRVDVAAHINSPPQNVSLYPSSE